LIDSKQHPNKVRQKQKIWTLLLQRTKKGKDLPYYEKREMTRSCFCNNGKRQKISPVKKQHEVVYGLDGKRKTTKQSCW